MYTLKEDYTEPYGDGSGRFKKVFSKGQSINWETAKMCGLVEGEEPTTKVEAEAKAKPEKAQ